MWRSCGLRGFFADHASDPVMAQTRYPDEEGVIRIEVGKYAGKTGRNVRELSVD